MQALGTAKTDLSAARSRLDESEDQLSKSGKSSSRSENQYRDQITERNSLLLTVYQAFDRILGPDKSPVRTYIVYRLRNADTCVFKRKIEPKPYTNFGIFHDLLLTRLKDIGQTRSHFERKIKDIEKRFEDKFGYARHLSPSLI